MGATTKIAYRSSVDYSLADRAAGTPWLTSLPFPVSVVAQVEEIDDISRTRLVRTAQYADGYFDPVDRQFAGFGRVEVQDSLTVDSETWHFPAVGREEYRALMAGDGVSPSVEPLFSRSWQQVGSFEQADALRAQMLKGAFRGTGDTLFLPGPTFSPAFETAGTEALRLAYKALGGRALLGESYGVDPDGSVKPVPYSVSQACYGVELLQPCLDGHPAVVLVVDLETAVTSYEQEAGDPAVQHSLAVAVDRFGQPIRTAEIGYARPAAPGRARLPGQTEAMMRLRTRGLINHTDGAYRNANGGTTPVHDGQTGGEMHVVGLPFEEQDFEVAGFAQPAPYFTRAQVRDIVGAALGDVVPYGAPFSPEKIQARLFGWQRSYYWDADRTGTVLQRTGPQLLAHHEQQAAFSDAFVAEVFGERVDGEYLRESGGYRYEDGYFWSDGQTVSYEGASLFYLPAAYTDPFGARTEVAFDKYQLLLTRKTDATGFSVRADYDYQALQPSRVVNENDDVEEYLYDPLGEVMVQAQYGTEGDRVAGDEPISKYVPVPASSAEEVLNDPQKYLQGAGAYYYYALDAWEQSPPMPVFTLEVRRRTWARPAEGGATDPDDVEIRLRYFDAALRRLAVAVLVSGVPPFSLRGPTTPALAAAVAAAEGDPPTQWLMTDQERFDNRGNAVVRYQPYFVPVPAYVAQPEAGRWTVAYDALYREIQTETPRGFLTATEHRAWSTTFWDEDDTVTRSPYYEQHFHDPDLPPAEKQALEMAVRLADTPTTTERDVLGRDIRVTALRVAGTDGPPAPPVPLHTTTWYDALDKPSAVADPRFYDPEDPARPRFYNSFVRYDMRGRPAWQKGADAGNVPLRGPVDGLPWIRLYDSMDNALDEWDRRGFRSTTEYDVLRLPTGSVLRGDGFDALVERIVYGTDPDLNNVHRIVEHDDQAGVERILLYSILGDAISSSRQMRVDAEGVADWRDPEKVPLQPTVWSWIVQGNALGEPVHYQAPNGATIATGRTRNGWPCLVALGGGATKVVAEARGFAPTGRPTETTLGNGLTVERTYDPDTLRLRRIRAVDGTGTPRQDLAYTYDPIGNVTNLENRVPAGGGDEPVNSVYRYDSLYRAILATGRRQTAGPGSTIEPYSQEYRYDDSGNLTEVLDAAGPAWSRRYVVSPSANHAITEGMAAGGPPDTFFDADGLMTALPDGAALYHNPAGRLSRVESESLGKSLFQYASNGVRLRKKTERGETYYLAPFIAEGTPADPAELAISLDDQMVAVARYPAGGGLPAPALLYQLDDRLQSVVERTDAEGARVDVQEFHPYGATSIYIASAGVPQDDRRYQFTGQERDPSTGLYAFPKRHYSPELARWIAPDPAGTVDGLNLFAYVRDNPLTLTDPTGQNGKDEKVPGSSPLNSIKTTFKTVNKWGVYSNALSEVLTASLHTPPYLTLLKGNSGPFLAAWQLKIGNIGAFGALFGGVSGMGYNLIDIHKKGFNFYNTTSLLGQIAFSFEGYNLYKSLLLQDKKAFHHAHTRIGFIGFAADALKVPSYIKSREYNQAIFYSGLSLGNLRTALPQETVESFFGGVARGLAAAYQRIGPSSRYPLSQQIVSSVPKTLAGVSGPQIIAATLFYQVVYKMFFSRKDDH
jgi:RHS repeat-associated protein